MKLIHTIVLSIISLCAISQEIDTVIVQKNLHKGWNLVAYPYAIPMKTDFVFVDIWDKIEIIKNFDNFYSSQLDTRISNLDTLLPGEGYLIKVSEDCSISWNVLEWDYSKCNDISLPSAFTPTDCKNNEFKVLDYICTTYDTYKLQVFFNDGSIIFETEDPLVGWDGKYEEKPLSMGSYIWKLTVKFSDGSMWNNIYENSGVVIILI